jgi:hypothetical protein
MKFMQDRSLYYASPIEIPAYEHTVREAERIGMSPEEILEYLKIGDAPPKVWRNFLKELLGDAAEEVLGGLKVEFIDSPFPTVYPSEEDGHLIVSSDYFRKGSVSSLYLDVILCLNLRGAFSEGTVPTIFEDGFGKDPRVFGAYAAMVKEGRRVGISDAEVLGRLQLPRFLMTATDYGRFLKALRLDAPGSS